MKVLLLSRYGRLGASSRVRSFQYLPFLESKGWQVDVSSLFSDNYLQALYDSQPRGTQVIAGYFKRFKVLVQAKKYDLIWIEKEAFPFMPVLVEHLLFKTGVPYIVDYDDALFHRYDKHHNGFVRLLLGHKIDAVMRHATLVIAGNEYLAQRARTAGAQRIEIIPTVVDLTRYKIAPSVSNNPLIVGWIGSPATSNYLLAIAPLFKLLTTKFNVKFVAVGASADILKGLPIDVQPWSEDSEVQLIQQFDIGIMPLADSPWERGKCGYKLIQYMACGLPVIASPVGVNKQIIEHEVNGFLAHNLSEWEEMLGRLLKDQSLRQRMGVKGRTNVGAWYSMNVQAPRLERFMSDELR